MQMVDEQPVYLTVPEIAARLRVGETTIKRALANGALRGIQVGDKKRWRVTVTDYQDWLDAGAPTSVRDTTE
jgi:excisionase family DNA binding protein